MSCFLRTTSPFIWIFLLFAPFLRSSETFNITREYAVQVSALVQENPATITLQWPQDSRNTPSKYTLYRRSQGDKSWGTPFAQLPGTSTRYVDQDVRLGQGYEYQVHKVTGTYNGYGYILAGMHLPLTESRGTLILVVDQSMAKDLSEELRRLENDLIGDGWKVLRRDVQRHDPVTHVKSLIRTEYEQARDEVKAVFLFGHVPVPYSGDIVPDGHTPHHYGAWPADVYYGDMDGVWTDHSVNNTRAADPVNRNVPGDGKFDQSEIPSAVELQVGRVDLSNMPGRRNGRSTFASERELLRQYLNKDHAFRHGALKVERRAILHDSFGIRNGEAFAASGYRNFAPFFGADRVRTCGKGEWIPTLAKENYLFAYGCGSGSYTSVAGLGNTGEHNDGTTTEIVEADVHSVFNLIFGSWLGDWDSEDNVLRSVLATRTHGLAAVWSGRPHWYMHPMAMGSPLGETARMTQNNGKGGPYKTEQNSAAGLIHIALMGDPTLRMHPVVPPSDLHGRHHSGGIQLTWKASTDAVLGYHVYRASDLKGTFSRVTAQPVTTTEWSDLTPAADAAAVYMVRAVKLEQSASGTYFNPSQGAFTRVPAAPARQDFTRRTPTEAIVDGVVQTLTPAKF